MSELSSADFIIEAAVENMEIKRRIFSELDEITNENTILASNTSSISITKIASTTKKPDKVTKYIKMGQVILEKAKINLVIVQLNFLFNKKKTYNR